MKFVAIAALAATLVLSISSNAYAQASQLYGTWRLISYTNNTVDSAGVKETVDIFGKKPQGFISYAPDGRMSAILVKEGRAKPANPANITDQERIELFESLISYGGTYKVEGSRLIHKVDISWNENWTGTTRLRDFRVDGRMLTLSSLPEKKPGGKLENLEIVWEKIAP